MALPEQIRKQTEAVQQLYEQLNADDTTGTAQPDTDETVTPVETVDDTPVADDTTETSVATPPPVSEHKSGEGDVPEETIVQKYKTLQGMYNAEVPRLHQQNREMTQRIQQMEQLLATMSQQPAEAAAPQVAERVVTDKDVEEYGESIDVMRRVSREEFGPITQRLSQIESVLKQLQTNVVPQIQAVTQRQQVTSEQQFWADLATAVPNYREINAVEGFQDWLMEADPLTGITRQTYLEDAQRALDARRVSNFFRTWLETTGQAAVAQSTGNATTSELEKQVSPGRSRGSGNPSTANKAPTYSPADITKFFDDVRTGKYKGKEAERNRIERDIFNAQREGRIIVNA